MGARRLKIALVSRVVCSVYGIGAGRAPAGSITSKTHTSQTPGMRRLDRPARTFDQDIGRDGMRQEALALAGPLDVLAVLASWSGKGDPQRTAFCRHGREVRLRPEGGPGAQAMSERGTSGLMRRFPVYSITSSAWPSNGNGMERPSA